MKVEKDKGAFRFALLAPGDSKGNVFSSAYEKCGNMLYGKYAPEVPLEKLTKNNKKKLNTS